jgi:hypothetical protein
LLISVEDSAFKVRVSPPKEDRFLKMLGRRVEEVSFYEGYVDVNKCPFFNLKRPL